jgi:hypothetical protein
MSQTHGTRTTDNSRRAGSIPGLSATRRTGLPRTPVQPLSTFGTSARPDVSDKLGKDGKLKGDERERRIKEGLCLYCGKPGHVAADCNKAATAKARASKVEPTESAVSKK